MSDNVKSLEECSPLYDEPLTRDALIRLLQDDAQVRDLITRLVGDQTLTEETAAPMNIEPIATPSDTGQPAQASDDTLRAEMAEVLALLAVLRNKPSLAPGWLIHEASEGDLLIRLVAIAAQWDRLLDLWDGLAQRCKQERRPAHALELRVLQDCLAIHNRIWDTRQASLMSVEPGTAYDYRCHQRVTPTGETIHELWLPGLCNAGGEPQKLPLVAT
ncbi:hypothetical protein ACNFBT_12300 [Pseudomonas sp. NY15181]|uniref:hypothetical protein n=1 Tax=Pseudomonas sp. NY15181 TaxID=3400349 RepID=UPI003A8A73B6